MENQQITVQDLDALRNVIDLASTRGAFRASEMADVGMLYNKLSQFLEAVIAQAQEQQPGESKGESNE
jgi:hypothetical protein